MDKVELTIVVNTKGKWDTKPPTYHDKEKVHGEVIAKEHKNSKNKKPRPYNRDACFRCRESGHFKKDFPIRVNGIVTNKLQGQKNVKKIELVEKKKNRGWPCDRKACFKYSRRGHFRKDYQGLLQQEAEAKNHDD